MTRAPRHETRPQAATTPPNHKHIAPHLIGVSIDKPNALTTHNKNKNSSSTRVLSTHGSRHAPSDDSELHSSSLPFNPGQQNIASCLLYSTSSLRADSHSSISCSNVRPRKHTMASQSTNMAASKRNSTFSEADIREFEMLQQADLSLWMTAIAIEDDDLTFSGKSLSTWYEEDRRRLSIGDLDRYTFEENKDDERRGRSRERPQYRKQASHGHRKHKSNDSSDHSSN